MLGREGGDCRRLHPEEENMAEDPASIARQLYENWNQRDFDASAGLAADDCEVTIAGSGERFHGPDGAREYARRWADAFPDGRITVDNVIAAGDHVACQFTGTGTHTGALRTPMGEIPATGRKVEVHLCDVHRIEGGKIRSSMSYFDAAAMMAQLGLMPETPTVQRV
jgi:steroid delta-isomerase-like uncharacterized protein